MHTIDPVAMYAQASGLDVNFNTVLVEGTSDVAFFTIAAELELRESGNNLFANDFAVVAAGERDQGGVDGLLRELITFRQISKNYLGPDGTSPYRFLGLFDNDHAGRRALKLAMAMDAGVVEFRDVICLFPVMNAAIGDPAAVGRAVLKDNSGFKGIDWEIEDMVAKGLIDAFLEEHPQALRGTYISNGGHIHRELTVDGKSQLLRYVRANAIHEDLVPVIGCLRGLRHYLGIR